VNAAKEWSDAELIELGNMLIGGLSIAEIARLLRRDHGDVRDKVVEVGRACRGSAAIVSDPAKVFEDRISPGDWRVEEFDHDAGAEVAIFGGPNARKRAIEYADWISRFRGDQLNADVKCRGALPGRGLGFAGQMIAAARNLWRGGCSASSNS